MLFDAAFDSAGEMSEHSRVGLVVYRCFGHLKATNDAERNPCQTTHYL